MRYEASSDSGFAFNPALLTEAVRHQLPAEPFEHLLRPIELHVPLADFQSWLDHLRWLRRYDWAEMTNSQMIVPVGIVNALKARARQGRIDKWSRTVALLTMLIVTSATGYAWTDDVTTTYLSRSDQNFVEACVTLLDALYQDRAQRAPAGPVAFFWLAQAAMLLPSIVAQCKGPTQVYFQWMEHLNGGRSRPPESKTPDRVLAYLIGRIADPKNEVQHRQPHGMLSQRERLRLFFGENKNRWTGGAVLRIFILVLSLLLLPLGGFLLWQSRQLQDESKKLTAAQASSIEATRKAFRQGQSKRGAQQP